MTNAKNKKSLPILVITPTGN
ncbi:Protein of unknown function [Lactobacillus delbrueckii subsp. lactis]|nr:Protein of unknown function [Lactobacillus delbrueckii subsp. lactis]